MRRVFSKVFSCWRSGAARRAGAATARSRKKEDLSADPSHSTPRRRPMICIEFSGAGRATGRRVASIRRVRQVFPKVFAASATEMSPRSEIYRPLSPATAESIESDSTSLLVRGGKQHPHKMEHDGEHQDSTISHR
jgi:hypothetical protein